MALSRLARAALVGSAATIALAIPVSAVNASEATGCSGIATSFTQDGSFVSLASAPGPGGTQGTPFRVDPQGYIIWRGDTTGPITAATWSVSAMGIPIRSGVADNAIGATTAGGVVGNVPAALGVADSASSSFGGPLSWALQGATVIPMTGSLVGTGGSCNVSLWIGGVGSGTNTPMFWSGIIVGLIGIALVVWMVLTTRVRPSTIDLTAPRTGVSSEPAAGRAPARSMSSPGSAEGSGGASSDQTINRPSGGSGGEGSS